MYASDFLKCFLDQQFGAVPQTQLQNGNQQQQIVQYIPQTFPQTNQQNFGGQQGQQGFQQQQVPTAFNPFQPFLQQSFQSVEFSLFKMHILIRCNRFNSHLSFHRNPNNQLQPHKFSRQSIPNKIFNHNHSNLIREICGEMEDKFSRMANSQGQICSTKMHSSKPMALHLRNKLSANNKQPMKPSNSKCHQMGSPSPRAKFSSRFCTRFRMWSTHCRDHDNCTIFHYSQTSSRSKGETNGWTKRVRETKRIREIKVKH
jgi:hypothetical protein